MPYRVNRILDEYLVVLAQGGDRKAFDMLVNRWTPRLVRHAWRLTGRRDTAEDAVQETWLAAVRGLHALDDPARFPGWIMRVATRRCTDHQRQEIGRRRLEEDLAAQPPPPAPGHDAGERETLRQAMNQMPGEQSALLSLFYVEEFSISEIAEIMNVPGGTVKSRLFNARNRLREILQRRAP